MREYDGAEYGKGVANSLNRREFQLRSLIGCYLEYASLLTGFGHVPATMPMRRVAILGQGGDFAAA